MELFEEFSTKKVKEKEESKRLMTANTSGVTSKRPTPDRIGKELIRLMQDEMVNWGSS